ncbi:MAG: gliding motility-associated C-terminal domain-containing protein [Saprospiraceae bacterium]|nr:gliding motility-associated C-terminal domain-containing protein [Saprospiraceae bacterium]
MDSDACIATASVDVNPFECPGIDIIVDIFHPQCLGQSGMMTAIPNGGISPYEYNWNSGEITPTITAPAGTYSVTVSDAQGCQSFTSVILLPGEEIIPMIIGDTLVCFGETGSLGVSQLFDDYLWSTGETTAIILWDQAGDYTVTVTRDGCVGEARITVEKSIEFDVAINVENNILMVELQGGINPFSYSWNNGSSADLIMPESSGIYSILVTDGEGCSAESSIEFTLNQANAYFAPDAFSPNADGINDVWGIFLGQEFSGIEKIEIFDRWGNATCSKSNLNNAEAEKIWDGKHLSGNYLQNMFVYSAQLKHSSGSVIRISGEISIIY